MKYTLNPTNTVFDTDVDMPTLSPNKKVGIFLSGGMESTILVKLAQLKYGNDNVICFFADNIFCGNQETVKNHIHTNINKAIENLNITPVYAEFDYEFHVTNRKESVKQGLEKLSEMYNVEFVMFGFTKLFFEVEPFRQDNMTRDGVYRLAYSNKEQFKSTIEEFHLLTGFYTNHLLEIDIPPEVYPILRNDPLISKPLKNLNKAEVVDLYNQMGLLDLLYNTTSCIRHEITNSGRHCGECFNCQQRSDAFEILNNKDIIDKTVYASDLIKQRRKQLVDRKNELH